MEFGNKQSFSAPGLGEIVFNDFAGTATSLGGVETPYPHGLTAGSGYFLQFLGTDNTGAGSGGIRAPYEDRANKRGAFGHIFRRSAGILAVEGVIVAHDRAEVAQMSDALRAICEPLLVNEGRYFYDPSGSFTPAGGFSALGIGSTARRFNTVRLYDDPDIAHAPRSARTLPELGGIAKAFAMTFLLLDPIWQTYTQRTTTFAASAVHTVPNAGNADTYPVFKVAAVGSPCISFTIQRSDGFKIEWTGSINPGHYIEINTYNETMYSDGNGSDRLGGLNLADSDMFTIRAGGDSLTFTASGGAPTLTVLSNDAWTM